MHFILAGLGNIGKEYSLTRHNAGFIFIDKLANHLNISTFKKKFAGECAFAPCNENELILLKPSTYVNNSGDSILQCKNFYKIKNENIFIFYDDIELASGKIKIRRGGGSRGHNGIRSIDLKCGNDFHRIHIGVGRPESPLSVHDYVMGKFNENELAILENINDILINNLDDLLTGNKENIISLVSPSKKS